MTLSMDGTKQLAARTSFEDYYRDQFLCDVQLVIARDPDSSGQLTEEISVTADIPLVTGASATGVTEPVPPNDFNNEAFRDDSTVGGSSIFDDPSANDSFLSENVRSTNNSAQRVRLDTASTSLLSGSILQEDSSGIENDSRSSANGGQQVENASSAESRAESSHENYRRTQGPDDWITSPAPSNAMGDHVRENAPEEDRSGQPWTCLCHKLILARHSPLIGNVLREFIKSSGPISTDETGAQDNAHVKASWIETPEHGRIVKLELLGINQSSMKSIVDFLYTGKLEYHAENLESLLNDAQKLKFESVMQLSESVVAEKVNISNCSSKLLISLIWERENVVEDCLKFITDSVNSRKPYEVYFELKKVLICLPLKYVHVLMSSDMTEETAEIYYEMLLTWVEFSEHERAEHLHTLMEKNIHLLSVNFLLHNASKRDVIVKNVETRQLALEAVQKKLEKQHSANSPQPKAAKQSGHELSKEIILLCDSVTRETPQQKYDTINEVWQEWKVDDRVTIGKGSQIEAVNATFLCIGGVDSYENPTNQLKMLDLRSGEVKTGPSMNEARVSFASCVMPEGEVIVFGGVLKLCPGGGLKSSAINSRQSCEMIKIPENVFCNSNPESLRWENLPDLPETRSNMSAVSLGNNAYVIGGITGITDSCKGGSTPTVKRFNHNGWTWHDARDMKNARSNCAATTHGGMIYVFGGFAGGNILNTCERYNPVNDLWQDISTLPRCLDHLAATVVRNKIMIMGGRYKRDRNPQSDNRTKKTLEYNVERNCWIDDGKDLLTAPDNPRCVKVVMDGPNIIDGPTSTIQSIEWYRNPLMGQSSYYYY